MDVKKALGGARRKVEVRVTQDIIDRSEQRDSSHCMIADAIKAAAPSVRRVAVDLQSIRFTDPAKGLRYVYLTPPAAQRALIDFDQGEHTEEFTFFLRQASQVVPADHTKTTEGRWKPATKAKQGVVPSNSAPRSAPVVLGGKTPPIGVLPNEGHWTKPPRKSKKAPALGSNETSGSGSNEAVNVTLATGDLRIGRPRMKPRQFGLRQLKP